MNLPDKSADKGEHRNYGLITLSIACCVVALSAGMIVLPELQTPAGGAAAPTQAAVQPEATSQAMPSPVVSPEEDLSATDRELLDYKTHGG